eukprot:7972655-Pyramimonas_sp.AAC.1
MFRRRDAYVSPTARTSSGCACRSRSFLTVFRADARRVIDLCAFMVAPPRHSGCAYLMVATGICAPP